MYSRGAPFKVQDPPLKPKPPECSHSLENTQEKPAEKIFNSAVTSLITQGRKQISAGSEEASSYKPPFTALAEVTIDEHPSAALEDFFLTSESSVKKQGQNLGRICKPDKY